MLVGTNLSREYNKNKSGASQLCENVNFKTEKLKIKKLIHQSR